VRDVIIRSDDMWVLMMLESDAKCGEDCRNMRRETAKLEAKSHGLFKFAYTNAHDNLVVQDGSLQVAGAYFNITGASLSPASSVAASSELGSPRVRVLSPACRAPRTLTNASLPAGVPPLHPPTLVASAAIPAMIVWPAGPKRIAKGFRMEHEVLASMLSKGYKNFFQNLRMFVSSSVSSGVRARGMHAFMTKEAPLLPRVMLLSGKTEATTSYAALSAVFASRAVFGLGVGGDATLTAAFGTPAQPALLVSGAGPHMAPPVAGNLTADVYAGWTRYNVPSAEYDPMRAWLDAALPRASIPVLSGPSHYRIHCGDRTDVTVCFIAVLPADEIARLAAAGVDGGAEGAAGTEAEDPSPSATLRRVASRTLVRMDWDNLGRQKEVAAVRLPLAFSAVDGSEQATFLANMKAGSSPGLIALNPRKRVFTVFKGASFSDSALYEFVLAVMDKAMSVQGHKEHYRRVRGCGARCCGELTERCGRVRLVFTWRR
jgi:hypothetical protein